MKVRCSACGSDVFHGETERDSSKGVLVCSVCLETMGTIQIEKDDRVREIHEGI